MVNEEFKAIVVGGGPVGLTAAHALSRAGINYVVLEHRHSVAIDVGASLVLWPQGLRVLAQLGLLERLKEIGVEILHSLILSLDGYKYKETWATHAVKENHGVRQTVFHRADLLSVLYDSLSEADKACILTNKKVTDIATNEHGVEVRCEDGSIHHGSIVIGADGVHSKVRRSMRELAIQSSASEINEEKPYLSEYRALWCTFPHQPGLTTGDTIEIHGTDASLQCINSRDRSWIFIYERLEKPTRDRVSYSQENIEALAARCGEFAISEHLKVKDVFPKRYTAGMANLEEGILEHWSWNRMVLVGDACHKFTPNQGLGFNNGIQDVVALVNELHGIMPVEQSGRTDLALDALAGAFSRYQDNRIELLQKDYNASASWTRMSAWRNWIYRLLDRYILPLIPGFDEFMLTNVLVGTMSESFVLNFVKSKEYFNGKIPWKYGIPPPEEGN
ncbi:hypothetical protein F5Y19DRAFT_446762 [Xylariaceae sp. FL1651]|nr:hypothetical protein F5Y19DRAFT_446762 [Xylariaceae sp. FL1651]